MMRLAIPLRDIGPDPGSDVFIGDCGTCLVRRVCCLLCSTLHANWRQICVLGLERYVSPV